MNKKAGDKRYVIVVGEVLHYRLRQVALKKKLKLVELVTQLLVEGLKQS